MGERELQTRLFRVKVSDLRTMSVSSLSHPMGEGKGEGSHSRNKKGAPTAERLLKIQKLLRAEDRVFGGFGHLELHHALGRNLNLLAGRGIASEAGGAVFQFQFAKAGQREGVLGILVSKLGQLIQILDRLLLADADLFSHCRSDLR